MMFWSMPVGRSSTRSLYLTFFHEFFVEVLCVKFVLDFRLDGWLQFQSLESVPVDFLEPRMLDDIVSVCDSNSFFRLLL
jgi:hypothetical protein